MATRFDLDGYGTLLDDLIGAGYHTRSFDDCPSPARGDLLLRHDVDYCLSTAAAMAEVEAARQIASTWFILVRSPLFNPFGAGEREQLRSLRDGGGRIGLQFDASYYPDRLCDREALELAAHEEIAALETASGGPVVAVSFHKPPPLLKDCDRDFVERPHCSEPRFMRDILYCSDTLAQFSYGEPMDHARQTDLRAMQLLTHPIWWSGTAGMSGLEKLDALAQRRVDLALEAIERSVTAFERASRPSQAKGSQP